MTVEISVDVRPLLVALGDTVPDALSTSQDPRLRALLGSAEVTFANLEIPLTTRGKPAEKIIVHRGDVRCAEGLKSMGVDVVTLANNHALDFGPEGLDDTISALVRAGIDVVGAGSSLSRALDPVVVDSESGRVALFGFCSTLPSGFVAGDDHSGVAPIRVRSHISLDSALFDEQPGMAPFIHTRAVEEDVIAATNAIARVRDEVDLVVVGLHWGIPEGLAPASYGALAEYQRPLGHALIDAGADLIVGHHPHVVQAVELYRHGAIAYSIGNFMFHNWAGVSGGHEATGSEPPSLEPQIPSRIPIAPYRNVLASAAAFESVVVVVLRRATDEPIKLQFIPTVMVEGMPTIADRERSRAILSRLLGGRPESSGAVTLTDSDGFWKGEVSIGRA